MSLIFIQEHCFEIETSVSKFCVSEYNKQIDNTFVSCNNTTTTTELKKVFIWARGVFVFFFYKHQTILFVFKVYVCLIDVCRREE